MKSIELTDEEIRLLGIAIDNQIYAFSITKNSVIPLSDEKMKSIEILEDLLFRIGKLKRP
jgi:hypothetical protein